MNSALATVATSEDDSDIDQVKDDDDSLYRHTAHLDYKPSVDVKVSKCSPESLKLVGNRLLVSGRHREAVACYSSAIELASANGGIKTRDNLRSILHSNRAIGLFHVKSFKATLLDCQRAIDLDPSNVKAHFFAGRAHLELASFDSAISCLVQAHSLALEQGRNYGDEITSIIRSAKRKRFEAVDEKRRREEIQLQSYLIRLIREDGERQRHQLAGKYTPSYHQPQSAQRLVSDQLDGGEGDQAVYSSTKTTSALINTTEVVSVINNDLGVRDQYRSDLPASSVGDIDARVEVRIAEVNQLFQAVDARRQKREVPEALCGRISFDLMRDPVITPAGITYDRHAIVAHLRQVGHFDPLTRQRLQPSQLIPNLAMKELVQTFLDENNWAEDY